MTKLLKTAGDVDSFRLMWESGATVEEMADAFNCCADTIGNYRRRLGLKRRHDETRPHGAAAVEFVAGLRVDQKARAKAMLEAGLSVFEVRRMTGVA